MTNKLIIDANSLGHFSNNGSKLNLGDMPVQAVYGFIRTLRSCLALYQTYDPIVLWDGVSWRKQIFSEYKSNRDRKETAAEKLQALRKDEYKRQLPIIKKGLNLLGIPQISASNMEADDIGAILSDRYAKKGKVILMTDDKDWIQLVRNNVVWKNFSKGRVISVENFEQETGCKSPRQFVEMKALSGDSGDGIPGVGGIGEKGAKDFLAEFGSFDEFVNMVTFDRSFDLSKRPKKIRDLVEDESKAITFSHNIKLMDLRTEYRPKPIGLALDKGTPNRELFRVFCERMLFQSILQEYDEWIRVFPAFREV